ncbi:MAG TPA: ClpX C4-type zinc finger protein [Acidimicrobiales bacterium]|nr:ClpX C4-type zinc finger protein [Acidimicrobiales bacterium]
MGETNVVLAACSFCLRTSTEVATLVAGPGVFICPECVSLCEWVIANKPETVEQAMPWEVETSLDQALDHLPRVAAASAQVEANLAGWVRRARELGATWAQIGRALGITRQSAWERFSAEE